MPPPPRENTGNAQAQGPNDADDAFLINACSAIIDGEIVVPPRRHHRLLGAAENELKAKSTKIVMVASDLLYLNGYDLRKLPLIERKTHLKKLVAKTDIQFSESFEVDGSEMFTHACSVGPEGIVSKVRDSRCASGRGNDWVKKTCARRETPTAASLRLEDARRSKAAENQLFKPNEMGVNAHCVSPVSPMRRF